MLLVVATDIGLGSDLIDLFSTVVDVGAVVARTRNTGTSKTECSWASRYWRRNIYLDLRMSFDKSLVRELMVVFEFVEVVIGN